MVHRFELRGRPVTMHVRESLGSADSLGSRSHACDRNELAGDEADNDARLAGAQVGACFQRLALDVLRRDAACPRAVVIERDFCDAHGSNLSVRSLAVFPFGFLDIDADARCRVGLEPPDVWTVRKAAYDERLAVPEEPDRGDVWEASRIDGPEVSGLLGGEQPRLLFIGQLPGCASLARWVVHGAGSLSGRT